MCNNLYFFIIYLECNDHYILFIIIIILLGSEKLFHGFY